MDVQFGIDTFGDITADTNGDLLPGDAVVRNVIEEAVLADSLGLDVIGVGEHHRNDFAISSPEMVLAAIGAETGMPFHAALARTIPPSRIHVSA